MWEHLHSELHYAVVHRKINANLNSTICQMDVKHAKSYGKKETIQFELPKVKVECNIFLYSCSQKIIFFVNSGKFFFATSNKYILLTTLLCIYCQSTSKFRKTPLKIGQKHTRGKKYQNCFKLSDFIIGTGTYGWNSFKQLFIRIAYV